MADGVEERESRGGNEGEPLLVDGFESEKGFYGEMRENFGEEVVASGDYFRRRRGLGGRR